MFTDTEIQMKVWSMDKLTKNFNNYIIITAMIYFISIIILQGNGLKWYSNRNQGAIFKRHAQTKKNKQNSNYIFTSYSLQNKRT